MQTSRREFMQAIAVTALTVSLAQEARTIIVRVSDEELGTAYLYARERFVLDKLKASGIPVGVNVFGWYVETGTLTTRHLFDSCHTEYTWRASL
jgi:hypothetical protein